MEKLGRVGCTFSSAKLEHSSHSFFTCVTPPIKSTAGLVLTTEEVGELAAGDVAGELVDDISNYGIISVQLKEMLIKECRK
jgi:hypothetical protein